METVSGATFAFSHDGPPDLIENDLTNGSYRVMVGQAPVSEGPPMHVHPHTDEGFYIADGEMVFVFPDRDHHFPAAIARESCGRTSHATLP